jgi:hypothetical protein
MSAHPILPKTAHLIMPVRVQAPVQALGLRAGYSPPARHRLYLLRATGHAGRHATLVAVRLQTRSGTRLAVQHLAAFIAHHIRSESS